MVTAVYPGTFDPITNGHMDVIRRALRLFDKVIVAIATSKSKAPWFTLEERVSMAEIALEHNPNVLVTGFDNLLVDFCQQHEATVILRGLRAVSDFEYELQLAGMNRHLNQNIETLFLPTTENHAYISSSLVKEVAKLNGNITDFVPSNVKAELNKKIV